MIDILKKSCLSSLLILGIAVTSPLLSAPENDLSFACEKDGVTRQVEVVRDPGFACRVKYTRPSGTSFPWNARNEQNYCDPKAIELIQNLVSYGWECDSAEDVRSILLAQIERYGRYIKILNNVGKTCNFYPTEAQFGNLCGDRREEAAIVYTCEVGAAGWDQHLAVFLEIETEPLIVEVGSSESRQVSSYFVDSGHIVMETERLKPATASSAARNPVVNVSIQCRFSAASGWELTETN